MAWIRDDEFDPIVAPAATRSANRDAAEAAVRKAFRRAGVLNDAEVAAIGTLATSNGK